jgi:hypothetical protein
MEPLVALLPRGTLVKCTGLSWCSAGVRRVAEEEEATVVAAAVVGLNNRRFGGILTMAGMVWYDVAPSLTPFRGISIDR